MNAPKASPGPTKVKVSPTGRLNLPIEVRRAVGLEHGGTVVVEAHDGDIRIRTIDGIFGRARTAAREILGDDVSVDDFLKFRRELWRE